MPKLSIIIPVFNEENTVQEILTNVNNVELYGGVTKEIILINDASTDDTDARINEFISSNPEFGIKYFKHEKNKGKGAALHTGLVHATGDFMIVQDADLEYDPNEINLLLKPVVEGKADVVYGSRFVGSSSHRVLFFWHFQGNRLITFLSNMLTNLNLTDIETCYKLFKTDIIKSLRLVEERFGFEVEITAKISRIPHIRIYEVGISYYGRTYAEGKKISWKDGFKAMYCILKYNIFSRK
ncbi:MAG: glycosyltransferase family 2 protein [Bacteroidetes bacterium]|nr:glycosyltransferase family 2 protein [Bacteroidota bacterium]